MKGKLKRGLLILLTLVMVLSCLTVPALADEDVGDPNISGDDGGTAAGSESAFWGVYLQGVRISVYDIKGKRVRATADYSNLTNEQIDNYGGANIADMWFGYTPKTAYMNGRSINPSLDDYSVRNFKDGSGKAMQFPNCINSNDTTNFAAVKSFLCQKGIIEGLANDFNMSFEEITSENIKIIIEPVVFMKYDWQWYAMTATEAAVFEKTYGEMVETATSGGMTSLTERTLPLSVFLEYDDDDVVPNITAYKGSNQGGDVDTIIKQLGVGIISFADEKETEICCDCDQWCPCKFYEDGTKKTGDCRCFDPNDRQRHGHPDHIPCTPTYPDNCLCQLGTIKVKKVSYTGNTPLSGAKFSIVNAYTYQQLTGITGSDGYVTFEKVHMGKWIVTELQAPNGYITDATPYVVELKPGGDKTVAITVKNDKEPPTPDFKPTNNTIWASELTRSFTNETNLT